MSWFTLKNGEKLYYVDKGRGPDTLVMMHGWTSSHEIYLKPMETLQKRARVIVYDHRGHGESRQANSGSPTMETLASDLHELIQGLSLSNITLLGWSMGAGVVFNYVRLYGCENLKQIVLCDMTPKQLNDAEWKLGLYQGAYTKADMERDAGKDFYSLYKEFAIGAIPKLKKIPSFLLKKPLKYADPGSLFSPGLADWYRDHVTAPYRAVRFPESTHMMVSDYPEKFAKEVSAVLCT